MEYHQITQDLSNDDPLSNKTQEFYSYKSQSSSIKENGCEDFLKKQNYSSENQKKSSYQYKYQLEIAKKDLENNHLTIKKKSLKNNLQQQKNNQPKQEYIDQQIQLQSVTVKNFEQTLNIINEDYQINNSNMVFSLGCSGHGQRDGVDQIYDGCKLKFQSESEKYMIYQKLVGKQVFLKDISLIRQGQQEECIFKIYNEETDEEFEKEIKILKTFENPINIVKIIDDIKIEKFFILILEKCRQSLLDELKIFSKQKKENTFTVDKLLSIIFDLLNGLIQLRTYYVMHLDIKPGNILLSQEGSYCYADFGSSYYFRKNQEIKTKYFTKKYCSPEQINQDEKNQDFQSDVYSLGKTLQVIIDTFKNVNQYYQQKQQKITELIQRFENIITSQMTKQQQTDRSTCLFLHEQFLEAALEKEQYLFFEEYEQKINQIIQLNPYDKNKDIKYFQELNLFYQKVLLKILNYYNDDYSIFFANYSITINQSQINFKDNLTNLNAKLESKQQNDNDIINIYEKTKTIYHKFESQQYYKDNIVNQNVIMEFKEYLLKIQVLKGKYIKIMSTLNNIGLCYQNLKDYQNCLKFQLKSLEMMEQIYQGEHRDIAITLYNVGLTYQKLGDNKNSLIFLQKSLEMNKILFQEDDQYIALSLNSIGYYYLQNGECQKGLEYLKKTKKIFKQIFKGKYHLIETILYIANNLGLVAVCYKQLGYITKCKKYAKKQLEMNRQIFQGDHLQIAESLEIAVYCFGQKGDKKIGLEYFLESQAIREQLFQGENSQHFENANSLKQLELHYLIHNDYQMSLKYQLEQLQIIKYNFQGNHIQIADSLLSIGDCYLNLDDCQNSLQYLQESLDMYKQNFQENNSKIADSLYKIGECYFISGNYEFGINFLLESLLMRKQIYKNKNLQIENSLYYVGICYNSLKNEQKGLKYLLKSLQIKKSFFSNSKIEMIFENIGLSYKKIGNNQNSLKYLLESLEERKKGNQSDKYDIAQILNYVGQCYFDLGDNQNSLEYLQESLEIQKQIFQGNDLKIVASLYNLALVYNKLGDYHNLFKYLYESKEMMAFINEGQFHNKIHLRIYSTISYFMINIKNSCNYIKLPSQNQELDLIQALNEATPQLIKFTQKIKNLANKSC